MYREVGGRAGADCSFRRMWRHPRPPRVRRKHSSPSDKRYVATDQNVTGVSIFAWINFYLFFFNNFNKVDSIIL